MTEEQKTDIKISVERIQTDETINLVIDTQFNKLNPRGCSVWMYKDACFDGFKKSLTMTGS